MEDAVCASGTAGLLCDHGNAMQLQVWSVNQTELELSVKGGLQSYGLPLGMNILWFGCDVGTLCTTTVICEAVCGCGKRIKDRRQLDVNLL